jgi:hypothetical protein
MVSRKTFRAKREDVTGSWEKLHIEELFKLHSSPNNIMAVKSRMR